MGEYTKFKDAGRLERDYSSEKPISMKAEKPKMKTSYQRIKVDAKLFPYLHSKTIGSECELKVKVLKIAEGIPEKYEEDKDNYITLEIKQISEPKASNSAYKEIAEEGKEYTEMNK